MNEQRLYRLWDASDKLLYVGISKSAMQRIEQHLQNQPWAKDIARMTIELHPDRQSVEKAERIAIATENPLHNKRRYEIPDIPIEDLWPALSRRERRMVGSMLLVLANNMYDDSIDIRLRESDDQYLSMRNAIALVGDWFMRDAEPDQMLLSLFKLVEKNRYSFLRFEHEKIVNERKMWERTRSELSEDMEDLQAIITELRNENKRLKQKQKNSMSVVA